MRYPFKRLASSAAFAVFCGQAFAAPIDADAVNTAAISSLPIVAPAEKPKAPDPAIVHLQVLLDRAGASPGVIDGYFGDNLTKAIAGFEALQGLPVDGSSIPKCSHG